MFITNFDDRRDNTLQKAGGIPYVWLTLKLIKSIRILPSAGFFT